VIRGLSAPEVEAVYDRLQTLIGQVGDVAQEISFGLWNFYASRGKLAKARELGQERLAYGDARGDADSRMLGIYTTASADMFLGRLAESRAGYEALLAGYPRDGIADLARAYDIGVVGQSLLAEVLWLSGRLDAALRTAEEAIVQSRRFSPFTQSVVLVTRMTLAVSMRDVAASRQRAQELIALSSEYGFQYWVPFWGLALALTGLSPASADAAIDAGLQDAAGAIEMMRTAYGSNLQVSRFLGWTVDACVEHGRLDLARRLLDQALAMLEGDGERYWEADLRRLDGTLARAEGADADRVEAAHAQALAVAREQGARLFELRIAADVARRRAAAGRADEARATLAPVVEAFAGEGDTPDVAAARELLASITPSPD
jgi:tetratricopeptide (TPR) repeat protein